jgi:hypothetical protein
MGALFHVKCPPAFKHNLRCQVSVDANGPALKETGAGLTCDRPAIAVLCHPRKPIKVIFAATQKAADIVAAIRETKALERAIDVCLKLSGTGASCHCES